MTVSTQGLMVGCKDGPGVCAVSSLCDSGDVKGCSMVLVEGSAVYEGGGSVTGGWKSGGKGDWVGD